MAIRQHFAVKTVTGTTPFTLTAKPGESLLIKDIHISGALSNYATLKTAQTTVGYFRVAGALGNHIPFVTGQALPNTTDPISLGTQQKTVLGLLAELGLFAGYPLAEGETFRIETSQGQNTIISATYEIHDAEDIKNTDQNGSKSPTYTFMNYGHTGATINSATTALYDTASNPEEFPAFPFGKVVPPRIKATIHAIFASDVTIVGSTTTNLTYTQYIKLIKDREVLFDEDRNGIPMFGALSPLQASVNMIGQGQSVAGNYSSTDRKPPLLFNPPLTYEPGDELNIYITTGTAGTPQNLTTDYQEIGLWMTIERAE